MSAPRARHDPPRPTARGDRGRYAEPMSTPATLQGPGWRPRQGTLRGELGHRWAAVGADHEVDPLRAVLLVEPPDSIGAVVDPDAALMVRRPDLPLLRAQLHALAAAYVAEGVEVLWLRPPPDAPPNVIFARDLFWAGPDGVVVARMAAEQRAGEERLAAAALAGAGVPIRLTVAGSAVFEGADALALGGGDVLVGVGRRTDLAAVDQLRRCWPELRVEVVPVPAVAQHLLGVVNLLDRDLAAVHPEAGPEVLAALARRGVEPLPVVDPWEREEGRSINAVAVGPRRVVMPARCPRTREAFEAKGVACVEVDVSEGIAAAGAIGCLTGIVSRTTSRDRPGA